METIGIDLYIFLYYLVIIFPVNFLLPINEFLSALFFVVTLIGMTFTILSVLILH